MQGSMVRTLIWIAFIASILVAFVTTKVAIHVSFRLGVLDRPNERSSHHEPTPRLGGLGILASAAIVYGVCIALGNLRVVPYPVLSHEKMAMLGAGLAMAAIGLYDDLHHLTPGFKLLAQLFLALVIVGLGYRIEDLALAGWGPIALGWLSFPLTILWFAGFSNSFNFMDGINGMSAVTAATNFLFFALFAWELKMPALVVLAVILAGSCLGFLPHNFPRARTFMGDNGSLPLGFILAFFVVHLTQWSADPELLPALLLVCSVSLWDTGFTLFCRILRREPVWQSHRRHLYQRLVQLGHSHARITCLYFVLHLIMGCMALGYGIGAVEWRRAIGVLAFLILAGFTSMVYRFENRARRVGSDRGRWTESSGQAG